MFLTKTVLNGGQLPPALPPHVQMEIQNAMTQYQTQQMTSPLQQMNTGTTTVSSSSTLPPVKPAIPQNRAWAITFEEKQRYDVIFKANDPENLGFISGNIH
jgi:transcription initiation factor TFIID subunit TAF12